MQSANLLQQYKSQTLETLTKGEIVVKLFEEASKQISTAIFLINSGTDSVKAYNCISKAQKVISTLDKSLDMKYAISLELSQLYMFIHGNLSEALLSKDIDLLKRLLKMLDELKVTFRQAEKMARADRK